MNILNKLPSNYISSEEYKSCLEDSNKRFLDDLVKKYGIIVDEKNIKILSLYHTEDKPLLDLLQYYPWKIHPKKYRLVINQNKNKTLLTTLLPSKDVEHPLSKWWNEFTQTFVPNIDLQKCQKCGLKEFMVVKWKEDGKFYQECTHTHIYKSKVNKLPPEKQHTFKKIEETEEEKQSRIMREKYLTNKDDLPEIKKEVILPPIERFIPNKDYVVNKEAYDREKEINYQTFTQKRGEFSQNFAFVNDRYTDDPFKTDYLLIGGPFETEYATIN